MTDKAITVTFTGDNTIIDTALDAFVRAGGWTDTISIDTGKGPQDISNPESQNECAARIMSSIFLGQVKSYQGLQASKQAEAAANRQADSDLAGISATVDVE